jgi:polyribonucleotide nucleotidyltransferase
MKQEVSVELAGGKQISFETGKLAKQAHGSTVVRIGDNVVLATAVANPDPREGIDFFPLTVDYREYTYAGGRIPGDVPASVKFSPAARLTVRFALCSRKASAAKLR